MNSEGNPQISFMLESNSGFVKHAVYNTSNNSFDVSEGSLGYFYGPLDLALDNNDIPHISFHDHTFEDQVHSYLLNGNWINERVVSEGHDGWDNAIVIDANNNIHTSTVDPSGFGGVGVEYAFFNGTSWNVEAIGSAAIMYANATSLAIDKNGNPHINYFNDTSRDLKYASKEGIQWIISSVETEGDVGRFSSLVLNVKL